MFTTKAGGNRTEKFWEKEIQETVMGIDQEKMVLQPLAKYDNSYGRKSLLHAKLVKITRLTIGFLVDL